MTRTSKRWIAGLMGVVALAQPVMADGWLRSRIRSLCEPSTPPATVQPIAPEPATMPPAAPGTSQPGTIEFPPALPKVDAPPMGIVPPPAAKDAPANQPAEPNFQPSVSAALGDTSLAVAFLPAMFGDATSRAIIIVRPNPTPVVQNNNNNVNNVNNQTPQTRTAQRVVILQFPQISYATFKVAENESPRPTDRIFATYSYYNGFPTSSQTEPFDVHRETVGFEKTFLDGRASIGVRVPFLQLSGPDDVFSAFNVRDGQFGDVSVIGKYAFYDDRSTGNLLSGGLMVTAPTGQTAYTANGQRFHSTLIQPWGGYIWNLGESNFFVQGFSSIVIPSESNDVTAWYNDLGLCYWLRKGQTDRFFNGIVPTAEVHVGTPLNNRNGANINEVHVPDYVSLLGGVNFIFWRNSSLGFAAGAPVTGPRPWDFESHVTLNFRF